MSANPKFPLKDNEKTILRNRKVKLKELHTFTTEKIAEMLDIPPDRANVLKGLADFQSVPSIGLKLAEKLVYQLKIYSLSEIKHEDGGKLFDSLEQKLGVWTDPCVEDQIRCVIHYANNPKAYKQWFDFTDERKSYREKNGYPENRPTMAWYE